MDAASDTINPLVLVIREQQMQVFAAAKWREFADAATVHCRDRHATVCAKLTDADIRARVENGIRRARARGFEQTGDIMRYLDLLFFHGAEADQEPRAAEILSLSRYAPRTRIEMVFRMTESGQGTTPVETPARELPDATWPEPAPQPVPNPAKLEPPGPSCVARPPWAGGPEPSEAER